MPLKTSFCPRTPAVTEDMRLNGLAWKRLPDGTFIEACDFCGGNCGQCGMTGRLGNQGFSMERIAGKAINGVSQPPLDGTRSSDLDLFMSKPARIVLYVAAFLSAFVLIVLLTGCTSSGDYRRPISQGGTMVGPYDVTLTSHQEALGIRTR